MKKLSILFTLVLLLIPVAMVNAQEPLEVGVPIAGEITNSSFEVEFTFTGNGGDVIILSLPTLDEDGYSNDLDGEVILIDSSGEIVATTAQNYDFYVALVTQLPADDDYLVIVTREDGRAGDSAGTFEIELIVPPSLALGDSATGSAGSETGSEYFVINSEEDFLFLYEKTEGDFYPEIEVKILNDNNSGLDDFALASGDLDRVALGDFDAGIYVIEVSEGFNYYFDPVTADFEISVASTD